MVNSKIWKQGSNIWYCNIKESFIILRYYRDVVPEQRSDEQRTRVGRELFYSDDDRRTQVRRRTRLLLWSSVAHEDFGGHIWPEIADGVLNNIFYKKHPHLVKVIKMSVDFQNSTNVPVCQFKAHKIHPSLPKQFCICQILLIFYEFYFPIIFYFLNLIFLFGNVSATWEKCKMGCLHWILLNLLLYVLIN